MLPGQPKHKKQVYYITDDEAQAIFTAAHRRGPKWIMIFAFALFRGLRRSEIACINLNDFNADLTKIKVKLAKKHTEEILEIPHTLREMIWDYIKHNIHTFKQGYIFPSYSTFNVHITKDAISVEFDRIRKELRKDFPGMTEYIEDTKGNKQHRIRFHACRHWFETTLYKDGLNFSQIAEIMRYTSKRAVETYIQAWEIRANEGSFLEKTFKKYALSFKKASNNITENHGEFIPASNKKAPFLGSVVISYEGIKN